MNTAKSRDCAVNKKRNWILQLIPLVVLAAGATAFFGFGLHSQLNFDTLRVHRSELIGWVQDNQGLAVIAFVGVYAASIVFVPPSGTVMTVFGGFLFGAVWGTVWTVIGATIGATLLFLAAKYSVGDFSGGARGTRFTDWKLDFGKTPSATCWCCVSFPCFHFGWSILRQHS